MRLGKSQITPISFRGISSVARSRLSEKWKISEDVIDIIAAPSERSVHRFIEPRALFLAARLVHRHCSDPFEPLATHFETYRGRVGLKDPAWMKSTFTDLPAISFKRLHDAISEDRTNGFHINKRMEYFYSILRVFKDPRSLDHDLPPDPTLRFGYFLKVLTSGIRMETLPQGELLAYLEKEIATHARFYDADYHFESPESQFDLQAFPKWMSLGNIEEFKDKLKVTFAHPGPIEDLTTAYTPLCHWRCGHFSEALTLIGQNVDGFFRSLEVQGGVSPELLRAQGVPLIINLQVILQDLKEGSMESASDYYRHLSDDLHQKYGIPLLQYLYDPSSHQWSYLRQPAFESRFSVSEDSSNPLQVLREIENIAPDFLFYFLKTVEAKRSSERSKAISASLKSPPEFEDSPETIQLMGKALRELNDLQILECLHDADFASAVDVIVLQDFNEDSLPSIEVSGLLLKAIKNEPQLLKRLRDFLPLKHQLKDRVLEAENAYFLSMLRSKWRDSPKKSDEMMSLLKYFITFVEYNQNAMQSEAAYAHITNAILKHVRLCCDSLFIKSDFCSPEEIHQVFDSIQSFASLLNNTSQDPRLMVACWEGLFFSGSPGFYRLSEELLDEHPWVPQHLVIPDIIQRINRLENMELMSRLVDICQSYDLKDYKEAVLAEENMMDKRKNIFSKQGLLSLFRKKFRPR